MRNKPLIQYWTILPHVMESGIILL